MPVFMPETREDGGQSPVPDRQSPDPLSLRLIIPPHCHLDDLDGYYWTINIFIELLADVFFQPVHVDGGFGRANFTRKDFSET